MIDFSKIFTSIGNAEERKWDKVFEEGKQAGYEIGILAGRKITIQDTKELTDDERNDVYKFLGERNLEFCYDLSIGGLRIRKNK